MKFGSIGLVPLASLPSGVFSLLASPFPDYPSYTAEVSTSTTTIYASTSIATPWGFPAPPYPPLFTATTTPEPFSGIQIETINMTVIETVLWPGPVTSFPATVNVTKVSTIVMTDLFTESSMAWTTHTTISTGSYTSISTWLVYGPDPTYMPAGTKPDDVPCAGACVDQPPGDSRCAAFGTDWETGCEGQCKTRDDGNFWCVLNYSDLDADLRVGRICWSKEYPGDTTALIEPCLKGDLKPGCSCTPE